MTSENDEAIFRQAVAADPSLKTKMEGLGAQIFDSFSREAIRHGRVDISGKSPLEAIAILQEYALQCAKHGFVIVDDHRPTILEEARALKARNKAQLAVVLFATFFEHALNDIILAAASRAGLSTEISQRLIRSASIFEKTGSLLGDLQLPVLPKELIDGIRMLSSIRNEFIHYKWVGLADDVREEYEAKVNAILDQADWLVSELAKYEIDQFSGDYDKIFEEDKEPNRAVQTFCAGRV